MPFSLFPFFEIPQTIRINDIIINKQTSNYNPTFKSPHPRKLLAASSPVSIRNPSQNRTHNYVFYNILLFTIKW